MFARVKRRCNRLKTQLIDRLDLLLEIFALRHQLEMFKRRDRSPGGQFRSGDKLVWCVLSRLWPHWRGTLEVVQPDTVMRWRRRPWWRHLREPNRRRPGRPRIDGEVQGLIQLMASENSLWGSRRIVGELRGLGIKVSNSTVRRYSSQIPRLSPSQQWSAFISNHSPYLIEALTEALDEGVRYAVNLLARSVSRVLGKKVHTRAQGPGEVRIHILQQHRGHAVVGSNRCGRHKRRNGRIRDGPDHGVNAA